ncbi:uncharacterized protein ColSpa_07861 [Colletotrichum spaethianum]|uniref:Uncharacterized protein n=1 Tax=Colletotrichum spaethianum TaxID=700344 RepID=A0AA37P8N0_9PEZI|nr:uncharacterized protein ColSpa_07861 [Colletotrichum spaethianum]GKT47680.1 hypothetical protein ColSpa_07861 [Colletotrichum spaethianum]
MLMGHHPNNTQDRNSQQGYIASTGNFQGGFVDQCDINGQQHVVRSNGTGTYNGYVQQLSPALSGSRFTSWTQTNPQFPSFGQGHPHYQTAIPSFPTPGLPQPSLDDPKRSYSMVFSDGVFWGRRPSSFLQSPISQQSNYSPVTYQAGLDGQIMKEERSAKRTRVHEGTLGTPQHTSYNSINSTNVQDTVGVEKNRVTTPSLVRAVINEATPVVPDEMPPAHKDTAQAFIANQTLLQTPAAQHRSAQQTSLGVPETSQAVVSNGFSNVDSPPAVNPQSGYDYALFGDWEVPPGEDWGSFESLLQDDGPSDQDLA